MEKIDRAEAISKLKETVWDEKELKDIIKTLEELPEVKEYGKQVNAILDDFKTCKFVLVGCENCRAGAKIGRGNLTVCDVLTEYGQSIYRKMSDIIRN
jgi:methionine synthase I (cobalamin-dependent)